MNDSTYVPQVGGRHYLSEFQHWDLVSLLDLEYLPSCASAYVIRWDRRGEPLKDLEKAISFLKKQLAVHPNVGVRRLVSWDMMVDFFHKNELSGHDFINTEKRGLLELIHVLGSPGSLKVAIVMLEEMIKRESIKPSDASA